MSKVVECATHGPNATAFICAHALGAFRDRKPQPFFWTDAEDPEPCGWCAECQSRFEAAGEDWVGEAEEKLDAKLLCVNCFRDVIAFNGFK